MTKHEVGDNYIYNHTHGFDWVVLSYFHAVVNATVFNIYVVYFKLYAKLHFEKYYDITHLSIRILDS